MENCIFCKIVKGEVPSHKIYEDENFYAFLDIYPRAKGHTLVIPKKHYRWVYDVPNFGEYWEFALKITKAVQKAINPKFVSYITHGLDMNHAHIHILPRESDLEFVPDIKQLQADELKMICEKIKAQF